MGDYHGQGAFDTEPADWEVTDIHVHGFDALGAAVPLATSVDRGFGGRRLADLRPARCQFGSRRGFTQTKEEQLYGIFGDEGEVHRLPRRCL